MNRRDLLKGFLGLPVAGVLAKVGLSLPPPEPDPEPDDLLTRDWDDDDDDEWDDDGDGDVEYSDDWMGEQPTRGCYGWVLHPDGSLDYAHLIDVDGTVLATIH